MKVPQIEIGTVVSDMEKPNKKVLFRTSADPRSERNHFQDHR